MKLKRRNVERVSMARVCHFERRRKKNIIRRRLPVSDEDVLNGTNALSFLFTLFKRERKTKSFILFDAFYSFSISFWNARLILEYPVSSSTHFVVQNQSIECVQENSNELIKCSLMMSFSFLTSFMYFPINKTYGWLFEPKHTFRTLHIMSLCMAEETGKEKEKDRGREQLD